MVHGQCLTTWIIQTGELNRRKYHIVWYMQHSGGHFMSSYSEKVKEIIVEQLGVDAGEVKEEAKFIEDLGAD